MKISAYGKYLRSLMDKYSLGDKLVILGKLDSAEMKKQYLKSSLFVCPSAIENSPNSLGEAMLLGMPCIASRVGGIPSMATDEEISYVSAGSAEELAEAISNVFENREAALISAAAGRKRAMLTYDREANYKMLKWIYDSIIKDNS